MIRGTTARRLGRLVLAPAGGACCGLALPPTGWWPLAPIGVGMLAAAVRGRTGTQRALAGWCFGVAWFALAFTWALSFSLPGYLLLVAVEACFPAAACALALRGPGQPVLLAGSLTIAEWGRERWPLGGLPIGGLPIAAAGSPFLDLARLGGPLALSAATIVAGVAGAQVVSTRRRRPPVGALVSLAAVVVVAALAAFAPAGGPAGRHLAVDLVQGGGARGTRSLDTSSLAVLASDFVPTAALNRRADLVVWPEDTLALSGPLRRSPYLGLLGGLASRLHTTLVVGVTETVGETRFRNDVVAIGPGGRLLASVAKVHPVPFGEYVPLRSLVARVANLDTVPRDMIRGQDDGLARTPAGPLAVLVSFETFFAERGRSGVRAGGQLLVAPTNTASYSGAAIPEEELAAARIQAVAEGRDLVQDASVGISALVDPTGRVVAATGLGEARVLHVQVALRRGATYYERFGDGPLLVLTALGILGGMALDLRRRRAYSPAATSSSGDWTGSTASS